MNPLEQKIAQRITEGGPIPFEIFMDMALYDPEYGYYVSRAPRNYWQALFSRIYRSI